MVYSKPGLPCVATICAFATEKATNPITEIVSTRTIKVESNENIKNLVFDVAGVSDLFRYPVKVDVRRGAVEIDNRTYKAPELSHHNGRQVIAMKDPDGHKQDIEIVWGAQSICWAKRDDGNLADDLNQARTARIIELRSMRKEAKAVLDVCPPTSSIPTTTEREVKQAIRKNKPARRAKIHPVKLEIESDERKS